jgi:hypothetical protein
VTIGVCRDGEKSKAIFVGHVSTSPE